MARKGRKRGRNMIRVGLTYKPQEKPENPDANPYYWDSKKQDLTEFTTPKLRKIDFDL